MDTAEIASILRRSRQVAIPVGKNETVKQVRDRFHNAIASLDPRPKGVTQVLHERGQNIVVGIAYYPDELKRNKLRRQQSKDSNGESPLFCGKCDGEGQSTMVWVVEIIDHLPRRSSSKVRSIPSRPQFIARCSAGHTWPGADLDDALAQAKEHSTYRF